jgi:hypothetical protein
VRGRAVCKFCLEGTSQEAECAVSLGSVEGVDQGQESEGTGSGTRQRLSLFHRLNLIVGSTHKLGFASLISDFVVPLPFQPSPLSSSRAKQLG